MRRTLPSAWLSIVGVDSGWPVHLWVYVPFSRRRFRIQLANSCYLQSAGQTIKMVSYGVALLGLVVSATIYLHVSISLAIHVSRTDFTI